MNKSASRWLVAALVAMAWAGDARAGLITWGTAQQITGDADVSTNGVSDRAYLFAGASGPTATINGVTFSEFSDQATDTTTFTGSANGAFGSSNPPYSSLSTEYKSVLANGFFNLVTGTDATLTLNNLTVGTPYEIQVWVNDSRGFDRSETVSGSPTLVFNTTLSDGGLGQFVIGTFVADASSQLLTFSPATDSSVAQINGLQLRSIAAVPEPSSLVILGSGGLGLLAYGRRRRSRPAEPALQRTRPAASHGSPGSPGSQRREAKGGKPKGTFQ